MNTAAHQPWMDSQWFRTWLALARHVAVLCACVWGVAAREYYVSVTPVGFGAPSSTGPGFAAFVVIPK